MLPSAFPCGLQDLRPIVGLAAALDSVRGWVWHKNAGHAGCAIRALGMPRDDRISGASGIRSYSAIANRADTLYRKHLCERGSDLRFIIEFDGVVFDVAEAWYATHAAATQAVGWSRLDQPTLWRLIRTKGRKADVLPGAKPVKLNEYWAKFDEQLEIDDILAKSVPQEGIGETLSTLARDRKSVV